MKPQHCATPYDCCTSTHTHLCSPLPAPCTSASASPPLADSPLCACNTPPLLLRRHLQPSDHLHHAPPVPPRPPLASHVARSHPRRPHLTASASRASCNTPRLDPLPRTNASLPSDAHVRGERDARRIQPHLASPVEPLSCPAPPLCILFALLTRSCNTIPAGTSSAWRPRCRPSPRALRGSDAAATLVQRARPAADQASTVYTPAARRSSCETVALPFAPIVRVGVGVWGPLCAAYRVRGRALPFCVPIQPLNLKMLLIVSINLSRGLQLGHQSLVCDALAARTTIRWC